MTDDRMTVFVINGKLEIIFFLKCVSNSSLLQVNSELIDV